MTSTPAPFRIRVIPPQILDRIRAAGCYMFAIHRLVPGPPAARSPVPSR